MATFLSTFMTVVGASGKLKTVYITCWINYVLILVFSYWVCKMGYPPYSVFIVYIAVSLILNPILFVLAKKLFNFPVRFFVRKALVPILFVSLISLLPFYFVYKLLPESMFRSCIVVTTSALWTGIVVLFVGLRENERVKIFNFVKRKILFRQQFYTSAFILAIICPKHFKEEYNA
jgi:hypothetical protein